MKIGSYKIKVKGNDVTCHDPLGLTLGRMKRAQALRAVSAGLRFLDAADAMFKEWVFDRPMVPGAINEAGSLIWLGFDTIHGWSTSKLRVRVGCTLLSRKDLNGLKKMLTRRPRK